MIALPRSLHLTSNFPLARGRDLPRSNVHCFNVLTYMFQNYLKVALRNLTKHKGYSFINIVGLAIGVACFVLIMLYVQDERSFDRYHSNADQTYRIVEIIEGAEESASQPFPVAETLKNDYDDLVASTARFFNLQAPSVTLSYEPPGAEPRRFNEPRFFFTDSTVFDVFDFVLVRGNPATVLAEPNTILLTESMVEKYFGAEDPIGKTIQFSGQFNINFEVVGVLQDTPKNSHFEFDFLASMATMDAFSPNGRFQGTNWYWNPVWTYITLAPNADPATLEAQFPGFVEQYFPEQIKSQVRLYLQPLTDIHLHSRLDFEIRPNSDAAYVYIFSAIAFFVLLIACINFMNLTTARSAKRAREVGMRKVMGAVHGQLIRQFLGESTLLAVLGVLVAIPMIYGALPVLNAFSGKALAFDPVSNVLLVFGLLALAFLIGGLSGLYPAFFLAAFRPAQVLKGTIKVGSADAATWFRKGLVVTQFTISIVLIVGTVIAFQQLDYLRNKKLGFDKEQVVFIPTQLTNFTQQYRAFKSEALQHTNIRSLTVVEDVIGKKYQTETYQPEGRTDPQQFPRLTVHDDFIETFGLTMAAGRGFSEAFPADSSESILINESMVQTLDWGSAEEAIGKRIQLRNQNRRVVGVVQDYHYASLHQAIGPFVIERYFNPGQFSFFGRYAAVRIAPNDVSGTLAYLEGLWNRMVPNRAFEYFFLDDDLDALYKAEMTLGNVATAFSFLAIFVACLGLFGMASYTTEQRTKEIGVRKVMGATVPSIVMLLSQESVKLVGVAFVIACPVAFFAINTWLQSFAFQTSLGVVPFVIAGALVLAIAWLTVSLQTVKAALVNPAQSLQYE